jgi:hypothetical protein
LRSGATRRRLVGRRVGTIPGWDRHGLERLVRYCARPTIERIFDHIGEPTQPPAVLPARSPPQLAFGFDQALATADWPEMDQTAGLGGGFACVGDLRRRKWTSVVRRERHRRLHAPQRERDSAAQRREHGLQPRRPAASRTR